MSLSTTINVADYSPHAHPTALYEKWRGQRPPSLGTSINGRILPTQCLDAQPVASQRESAAHAALLLAGAALLQAGVHGKRRLRAMHAASRARLT